jgi:hypothetical protein
MSLTRFFLPPLFAGLLASCSLTGPVRDDPKATGFAVRSPASSSWQEMKDRADADRAWVHKKTGATLALRSLCRRYEHLSLTVLTQNLMNTLTDPAVQSQDEISVAGRAALSTRFTGQIDGVTTHNRVVVLRKDNCIFDFTLTQLAPIASDVMTDYDAFVASFSYSGGEAK